ncbi:helix-turn-helix domain-containing protein [Flagellimonas marinaquae]|uniref:helix-turn-helix domain-containing protein n=1 Tax=Flagellimonas aurea TaxID=2915619 RepID=UPI001CE11DC1|nr:helix-turn-helix domain-containing protein [Allomuricauda aquimarina]
MNPDYSIVGNTITMRLDYMDKLMEKVAMVAADAAVEKYKEEMMRDEKLSSKDASIKIGVSKVTLIRYITNGKKIGGRDYKLKATKTGRDYIISRFDLEKFRARLETE